MEVVSIVFGSVSPLGALTDESIAHLPMPTGFCLTAPNIRPELVSSFRSLPKS
jgi:hypothetical protein